MGCDPLMLFLCSYEVKGYGKEADRVEIWQPPSRKCLKLRSGRVCCSAFLSLQSTSPLLGKGGQERKGKEEWEDLHDRRFAELEESYREQISEEKAKLQDQLERGEIKSWMKQVRAGLLMASVASVLMMLPNSRCPKKSQEIF